MIHNNLNKCPETCTNANTLSLRGLLALLSIPVLLLLAMATTVIFTTFGRWWRKGHGRYSQDKTDGCVTHPIRNELLYSVAVTSANSVAMSDVV